MGNAPDQQGSIAADTDFAVADAHDRSPVPGMDRRTFESYVSRALSGEDDVPAAILALVDAEQRGRDSRLEGKARERWQENFWHQVLHDNLRRIRELIDTKQTELDLLLADIRDGERLLTNFERHRQAHDRAMDYFRQHGEFELDQDGNLADEDAEDMLRAWETRTGKKVDRRSAHDVNHAFKGQQEYENGEAGRMDEDLGTKRERAGKLKQEIKDLEAARDGGQAALDQGADPRTVSADVQRTLIAKGAGTSAQKQALAEERGLAMSVETIVASNADEFGEPALTSAFNALARGPSLPPPPEPAVESVSRAAALKPPPVSTPSV